MATPGPPPKARKVSHPSGTASASAPAAANIIIQFQSQNGETSGPQLDVPHDVTPKQLEALLNNLLLAGDADGERLPYSFFIEDQELGGELGEQLRKSGASVEAVLKVVYRPQAVFRVRAVARCRCVALQQYRPFATCIIGVWGAAAAFKDLLYW
jgi:ribosome assembly protein 4